jgi:hypothetical protein
MAKRLKQIIYANKKTAIGTHGDPAEVSKTKETFKINVLKHKLDLNLENKCLTVPNSP